MYDKIGRLVSLSLQTFDEIEEAAVQDALRTFTDPDDIEQRTLENLLDEAIDTSEGFESLNEHLYDHYMTTYANTIAHLEELSDSDPEDEVEQLLKETITKEIE